MSGLLVGDVFFREVFFFFITLLSDTKVYEP